MGLTIEVCFPSKHEFCCKTRRRISQLTPLPTPEIPCARLSSKAGSCNLEAEVTVDIGLEVPKNVNLLFLKLLVCYGEHGSQYREWSEMTRIAVAFGTFWSAKHDLLQGPRMSGPCGLTREETLREAAGARLSQLLPACFWVNTDPQFTVAYQCGQNNVKTC